MVTAARPRGRPFAPNTSGNPKGRPKNARNRVTLILEAMMEQDAVEIVAAVLAQAKAGDLVAAKLILGLVVPPLRDRRIDIDLPATGTAGGVAQAQAAVVASAASGEIRLSEATALAGLIEAQRRAVETADFDARLAALEARGAR